MATPQPNLVARGSLSILFGAAAWGLFWIPMRYFHESGLDALWSVAAINFAALLVAIPAALLAGELRKRDLSGLLIIGAGMGVSNVFYFSGLILSDVIRVTFLFYLLPIWATLFSRLIYGEQISRTRMIAIALAIIGIWLLLGGGGWPLPDNAGDYFGLFSGMGWAFGLTMIRGNNSLGAFATVAFSHGFALLTAVALGLLLAVTQPSVQGAFPSFDVWKAMALPVLLFSLFVLWPTNYSQLWGARFVAATTASLLTMSEILVATSSATWIGGERLSLLAWVGGAFIIVAVMVDLSGNRDG